MSVIYVPRTFGGCLILTVTAPVGPVPTLIVPAYFRSGLATASYRDGSLEATYRDGTADAAYRNGTIDATYRDGNTTSRGR